MDNGSWDKSTFVFSNTGDSFTEGEDSFGTYNVTEEGYLALIYTSDGDDEGNTTYYHKVFSDNDDYLTLTWSEDSTELDDLDSSGATEYYFYVSETADDFIANNPIESNDDSSTLASKLMGNTWAEFKPANDFPTTCYILSDSENNVTAYFNGDASTGWDFQYEVTSNQLKYLSDGSYVASTDTFTENNEGIFDVHKVWSDDTDDRTWVNMQNCLDDLASDPD